MKDVYLYDDQGVDAGSLEHTQISLQKEISRGDARICKINASQVGEGKWRKRAALFVMPGGRDRFYVEALKGQGAGHIKEFVEEGGSYLGICAGAYYAASSIEFEVGGNDEVTGDRPLQFFPGVARGPAYGNGKYAIDSHRGVEAALIKSGPHQCRVYFNGGCTFCALGVKSPSVEVLASYQELEGCPPAVIDCKVGKGRALLSGVHLEYSAHHFSPAKGKLAQVYSKLNKDESLRQRLFSQVMSDILNNT